MSNNKNAKPRPLIHASTFSGIAEPFIFSNDHEEPAAIERRKRDEVYDGKVQRNDAEKLNEINRADLPVSSATPKMPTGPTTPERSDACTKRFLISCQSVWKISPAG